MRAPASAVKIAGYGAGRILSSERWKGSASRQSPAEMPRELEAGRPRAPVHSPRERFSSHRRERAGRRGEGGIVRVLCGRVEEASLNEFPEQQNVLYSDHRQPDKTKRVNECTNLRNTRLLPIRLR